MIQMMKNLFKIRRHPCYNCISLAICKTRLRGIYSGTFIVSNYADSISMVLRLADGCKLLDSYLHSSYYIPPKTFDYTPAAVYHRDNRARKVYKYLMKERWHDKTI